MQPSSGRTEADLVVDIGNVHDKVNVVAKVVSQYASNEILSHIISRVPQMAQVIHGRATRVPGQMIRLARYQFCFCAGQGIDDFERRFVALRYRRLPSILLRLARGHSDHKQLHRSGLLQRESEQLGMA